MKILKKLFRKEISYQHETPIQVDKLTKLSHKSFIGRYSYIGKSTIMGDIKVGRFCSIANGFSYFNGDHDYQALTTHPFIYNNDMFGEFEDYRNIAFKKKPTQLNSILPTLHVGSDVWIGSNVTVLKGCREIGDGAVVGACSVVTKDIPPYSIVVGNPAKVVKFRFDKDTITRLLNVKWWTFELRIIRDLDFSDIEKCLNFLESQNG